MRSVLISLFGAIITLPAIAIIVNGIIALTLWLVGLMVTIDFAGLFVAAFWWANALALVGTVPVFLHILAAERRQTI